MKSAGTWPAIGPAFRAALAGIVGWLLLGSPARAASVDRLQDLNINAAVVGPGYSNVLKGMTLAVDASQGVVYVGGIVSGNLGIVGLTNRAFQGNLHFSTDEFSMKYLSWDPANRWLWAANHQLSRLWILDADSRTVVATRNISAELVPLPGVTYLVADHAVDPIRKHCFISRRDHDSVFVYDQYLQKSADLLSNRACLRLQWQGSEDRLLVLASPQLSATNCLLILPQGQTNDASELWIPNLGAKPTEFYACGTNRFYLMGNTNLFCMDGAGTVLWRTNILPATELAVSSNYLGLLYQRGQPVTNNYQSYVAIHSPVDGTWLTNQFVRYSADHLAAWPERNLFIAGNGGDASVSLVSLTGATAHIKVGSSAEESRLTSDGNRLIVLNRLGGSQLVECRFGVTNRALDATPWPVGIAANEKAGELYVLSHFLSSVDVLDATSLTRKATIGLGLPESYGDMISYFARGSGGNCLAALMCEQGQLAIVDPTGRVALATNRLASINHDGGPGRFSGAVDPLHQRVYVYIGETNRLVAFSAATGWTQVEDSVACYAKTNTPYDDNIAYFSTNANRLFIGREIRHPATLSLLGTVAVDRVVGDEPGLLYGQRCDHDGQEYLVCLQGADYAPAWELVLATTDVMRTITDFDPVNRRLAVTDMARSRAAVYYLGDLRLAARGVNGGEIAHAAPASAALGTDFGRVPLARAVTNMLAISNGSLVRLVIEGILTNGAGAAQYRLPDIPTNIPAGGVSNLAVVFSAASSGGYVAQLRIFHNLTNSPFFINLAGEAWPQRTFVVHSAHLSTEPPAGVYTVWDRDVITNTVATPLTRLTTQFLCYGWSLLNHSPSSGSATNFTLVVTNDTVLNWWWSTNFWLSVSNAAHGAPAGEFNGWRPSGILSVTGRPVAYYHFTNWTGTVPPGQEYANPLEWDFTGPAALTAHFAENLAIYGTPEWWLAEYGWTNDFDAAALADPDADRQFTWQEYIGNSNPTNPLSFFHVLTVARVTGGPFRQYIQWPGTTGRIYSISFRTNPAAVSCSMLATNLPATPPLNVYTTPPAVSPTRIYQVNAQIE